MIKMKWEEILKVDYDPEAASERVARWHKKVRGRPEKRMSAPRTGAQGLGIGATKDSSRVQAYLSQLKLIFNGFGISKYYDHYIEEILGKTRHASRKKVLLDWLNDTLSDDEKKLFGEPFENSILEFLLEALEIWADIPKQFTRRASASGAFGAVIGGRTPATDSAPSTKRKYTSVDNTHRELWPDNVKQYLTGEEE
jgi:hypothetical protein